MTHRQIERYTDRLIYRQRVRALKEKFSIFVCICEIKDRETESQTDMVRDKEKDIWKGKY